MTEQWSLRPLAETDLDALVELDSDPAVMRYINGGEPTPRRAYEDYLLRRLLDCGQGQPGLGTFMIEQAGRPLGWVLLRPDYERPDWLEIGYRLHRHAWGQGVATWAATRMRDRAFAELGADTVCARAMPGNTGSRRVMEKIGLRYAGEFTFPERVFGDGSYRFPAVDGVLYLGSREA